MVAHNFLSQQNQSILRLPAEWEAQDAILLAWPHQNTDWYPILDQVTPVYIELIQQISRFETVIIIAPDLVPVRSALKKNGLDSPRIILHRIDTNDTWIRDFGPLTVYTDHQPVFLDFIFDGWGAKFPATKDNQATGHLYNTGIFDQAKISPGHLILEGGSLESDGSGTLLTTTACLLNPNRNPHLTQKELEVTLSEHLGFDHFLWLNHGWLAGDDTDSHIDTLARLAPNDTICYIKCDDATDVHYPELKKMEAQLQQFKTKKGQPFRLIPLPLPQPCYDGTTRLPASYANFLIINQAVLIPTYNDPADSRALQILGKVFPERKIIGIDCRTLIKQHGSLHCITMQLPRGVLQ
jgi:agmatine deiminase